MEWVSFFFWRLGILACIFWLWILFQFTLSPVARSLIGLDYHMPRYDAFIESAIDSYNYVTGKKKNERKPNK